MPSTAAALPCMGEPRAHDHPGTIWGGVAGIRFHVPSSITSSGVQLRRARSGPSALPAPRSPRHREAVLLIPDVAPTDGVVCLRTWSDADVNAIREACQDRVTQRFIPIPRPYRRADAVSYIERTRRQWRQGTNAAFAIADAQDPTVLMGAIDLALSGATGNAAYWIIPSMRGRGIARRALKLLTQWALPTIPLALVMLEIRPENIASQKVATAAGFHYVGSLDVNEMTGERDGRIYTSTIATIGGDSTPRGESFGLVRP